MTITRGNVYSFVHCQFYRVTPEGYPIGTLDPDNLTPLETSNAYKVAGGVDANFGTPEFQRITFRDGSKFQGAVDGGLIDPGQVEITINFYDATLNNLFFGVNVDTSTITNTTQSSYGYTTTSPYDVGVLLTSQIYSRDASTRGSSQFVTYVIPLAQARINAPSFNQDGGENPSTATITLQLKVADNDVIGVPFGSNQNFEGNEELMYTITSDKPYSLMSYVADGIATTYTTEYLPTSEDVAGGNTTNYFGIDGVVTAPTSISATTGVVTLAAAGNSGDVASAFYQTDFVSSP